MTNQRIHLGTTCLFALLAGTALAQGAADRARAGSNDVRFIDASKLRGAIVYATQPATTSAKSDQEDAGVGQTDATQPKPGPVIGSVADLIACTGHQPLGAPAPNPGSSVPSTGAPVKAIVRLYDGEVTNHDGASGVAGTAETVTVALTDLKWNAAGNYFICNKGREALCAQNETGARTTTGDAAGATGKAHASPPSSSEWKFSDLIVAPLKTSDDKPGRVGALIVDTESGTVPYVLASGLANDGAADASGGRDHTGTTDRQGQTRKDAVPMPPPSGSLVIPFGVLAVEDGTKATERKEGEDEGQTEEQHETQRTPTPTSGGLRVRVPMASSKLAGAPALDATDLQRLADMSFRAKIEAFYRSASTADRRGQ